MLGPLWTEPTNSYYCSSSPRSMSSEGAPTQYYVMPPKKIKSVVVPCNKQAREVLQADLDVGPLDKRTRSSEAEIFITITQPVNNNKLKRDRSHTKHNPTCSGHKRLALAIIQHGLYTHLPGYNTPAVLLLLQGNISSCFNSPHCPGGLGPTTTSLTVGLEHVVTWSFSSNGCIQPDNSI